MPVKIKVKKVTTKDHISAVDTEVIDKRQGDVAKEELVIPESVKELAKASGGKDRDIDIEIDHLEAEKSKDYAGFVYVDARSTITEKEKKEEKKAEKETLEQKQTQETDELDLM